MDKERPVAQKLAGGVCDLCGRTWWVFLIGGIAAVIFGVMAFLKPGIALLVLAMFFAAYVLVDGAVNIWGALSNRDKEGWWAILLFGIAGVIVGGFALLSPPVSMLALIYVVSFVAMFLGVSSIYLGWKIREEIAGEWVLFLIGAASILFALLILFNPGVGGISVAYMIATWAIFTGVLRIWFAFKIRKIGDRAESLAA